jgi:hypothetical protein
MLRRLVIIVAFVSLCPGSAWGEEWLYGTANKNGFTLELAFWTNGSNQLNSNGTGFIHQPPLIIHSTAKYTGQPSFLKCATGFLQFGVGCYQCPPGFDVNAFPAASDQRKCVKFYSPVTAFDSIYDKQLVANAGFTKRQIECIFSATPCYLGIIGGLDAERYGVNCGWKFGGGSDLLTDNVDKCCKAHDSGYWKDNMGPEGGNPECANDVNLLRCVNKVLASSDLYFTAQDKAAAQWIKNALNIPTGGLCQSDWNTNDGGRYPWSAAGCPDGSECYSHIFEDKAWYDDPSVPATWCANGNKPPTCTERADR